MSSQKGKETKQGGGKYLLAPRNAVAGHQRSDDTALCYLFWSFVLLSWEGVFLT